MLSLMMFNRNLPQHYEFSTASTKAEVIDAFRVWAETPDPLTDPGSLKTKAFYQKVTFKHDTVVVTTAPTSKGSIGCSGDTVFWISETEMGAVIIVTLKPGDDFPAYFMLLGGGTVACLFIKWEHLLSDVYLIFFATIVVLLTATLYHYGEKSKNKGLRDYMMTILSKLNTKQSINAIN